MREKEVEAIMTKNMQEIQEYLTKNGHSQTDIDRIRERYEDVVKTLVQGGIALTSPPAHKQQTSGLTKKVRSVYQTNCEMAVVKAALKK